MFTAIILRMMQGYENDLEPFPPLENADKNGLLAIGGDLTPKRLINAYSLGIFPWFEQDQPILWWSPDPRCVLYPASFHTSRSLQKTLRKKKFKVSFDKAFESVVKACAVPRQLQSSGTWITPSMRAAYTDLHNLGCAHSVEVWQDDRLVGGLYGVSLGRVFFGESMFSQVSDSSKFALKCLCEVLADRGYHLIDCQLESAHLMSLGAQCISRTQFVNELNQALQIDQAFYKWCDFQISQQ